MVEHINREDVRSRLDRLRREYGDVPVLEADEEIPPADFERLSEDAVEGYTGGGYAWVVREPDETPPLSDSMPPGAATDRPQVLLMLERGVEGPKWEVAGGGREDGETYEAAAERELEEETGVVASVDEPCLALYDRLREDGADDGPVLHTLWVCFDATYEGGGIDVQQGELRGAAWFESPPAELRPWAQYRAAGWWDEYDPEEPWWEEIDAVEEAFE